MRLLSISTISTILVVIYGCKVDRTAEPCKNYAVLDHPKKDINSKAVLEALPKFDDFLDYFEQSEHTKDKCSSLMFWSGTRSLTGPESIQVKCSRYFAGKMNRYTLEMLLGDRWKEWSMVNVTDKQSGINNGGKHRDWDTAKNLFWVPASRAFACFARDRVIAYQTEERWNTPDPKSIWVTDESGIVKKRLGKGITYVARWSRVEDKEIDPRTKLPVSSFYIVGKTPLLIFSETDKDKSGRSALRKGRLVSIDPGRALPKDPEIDADLLPGTGPEWKLAPTCATQELM
jgi:hypothetical protein